MSFRRNRTGAFTLVEIMVVVVVLAILAAAVLPNVLGQRHDDKARVAMARSHISTYLTTLENFRLDMRRYPSESEGLAVLRTPPTGEDSQLWQGPYLRTPIQKDPWGGDYVYYSPAPNGLDEVGIVSYGSDKLPGGTGFAADIMSWEEYNDGTGAP